jgi:hypothetical protein
MSSRMRASSSAKALKRARQPGASTAQAIGIAPASSSIALSIFSMLAAVAARFASPATDTFAVRAGRFAGAATFGGGFGDLASARVDDIMSGAGDNQTISRGLSVISDAVMGRNEIVYNQNAAIRGARV